jgi:hypothetical protein
MSKVKKTKGYVVEELEIKEYVRRPFKVEGVQVTEENMETVAIWCDGRIFKTKDGTPFVKVTITAGNPKYSRTYRSRAFVGDWVLDSGKSFKVYTSKAFEATFE